MMYLRRKDFNPLPPRGGRHDAALRLVADGHFNPLPPRGGRRAASSRYGRAKSFQSTPSSRRETRRCSLLRLILSAFQSTPSSRRETRRCPRSFSRRSPFQSTPSSRRETRATLEQLSRRLFQSTPSSRRETGRSRCHTHASSNFNPLPPRGGRLFALLAARRRNRNFNPLPPRGGRHALRVRTRDGGSISIHSLLAEGDEVGDAARGRDLKFQSTPSSRRETAAGRGSRAYRAYFNPLPPRGGRLAILDISAVANRIFQSTPSSRRETTRQV